jgi:hypothetical protein
VGFPWRVATGLRCLDLIEDVRRMREVERLTYKEIAARLGTSRSAVAGICHRNNIKGMDMSTAQHKRYAEKPKKIKALVVQPDKPVLSRPIKVPATTIKQEVWLPLPGSSPIKLVDAGANHCRWLVGHLEVCGEPGFPYCATHAARVYNQSEKRHEFKAAQQ